MQTSVRARDSAYVKDVRRSWPRSFAASLSARAPFGSTGLTSSTIANGRSGIAGAEGATAAADSALARRRRR